jgi:ferritin
MISKKMQDAINEQINAELYSAYLYLAMAAFFESRNLDGAAKWMEAQAGEEQAHAMKFYKFVFERGGRVTLKGIDTPPAEWKSPTDVFESTYAHEQKVTGMINQLVELARAEKDYAAEVLLQWYVKEQVEEEATASKIAERMKMVQDSPNGMFMMDAHLGRRE